MPDRQLRSNWPDGGRALRSARLEREADLRAQGPARELVRPEEPCPHAPVLDVPQESLNVHHEAAAGLVQMVGLEGLLHSAGELGPAEVRPRPELTAPQG